MKLDGTDIKILVHLLMEGARSIELDGDVVDNRRRLQRLKRAGLCGCSPQQGHGGHRDYIWGINPDGIEAIELAESNYAEAWREPGWSMQYPPNQASWSEKVDYFNRMELKDIPRTKAGRDFWREIGRGGMHSALGEYTPVDEFEILLDYIDELEEKLQSIQPSADFKR